jgi:hypothetical protein
MPMLGLIRIMKRISFILFLLASVSCSSQQNIEVEKAFSEFKKAVLNNDCQLLCDLSNFPIESDAGLARLIEEETWDELSDEMKRLNYQITQDFLMTNCQILDSIEVEVLRQSIHHDMYKDEGLAYDGCKYYSNLRISDDEESFYWSVGCVELLVDDIGEYSLIFIFEKLEDEYKLKRIHGAG